MAKDIDQDQAKSQAKALEEKDKTPKETKKSKTETPTPRDEAVEQEFNVTVKETITRTAVYETKVQKIEVVNDIPLSADQEADWETHVPTYLPGHWDALRSEEPEEVLSEEIGETEFVTILVKPPPEAEAKEGEDGKPPILRPGPEPDKSHQQPPSPEAAPIYGRPVAGAAGPKGGTATGVGGGATQGARSSDDMKSSGETKGGTPDPKGKK